MTESKQKNQTIMYLFHEISSYLPLLEDEEFEALVEDIREFGQIEPIVLYEGKILDGRNRYRACKKLGIEPKTTEWKPSEATGITPLQYVISTNIMRRHLNVAQRGEIALLILPEIEKQNSVGRPKKLESRDANKKSSEIAGEKTSISSKTVERIKKIKKIAEIEPEIAKDWEKAKKEEIGIETVYDKAKVVEEAEKLPTKQKREVLEALKKEELPVKELKKIVQEKKDDIERLDLAKERAELRKKREEMEALLKRIKEHKNQIEKFRTGVKNSDMKIQILANEIGEKYPQWKGLDPENILTKLSLHYDTLDTEIYNDQLTQLKGKYDKLLQPLQEKVRILLEEYDIQKREIVAQKKEKEHDIKQIEIYEDSLNIAFDKRELDKSNITKAEIELDALLREYEEKYK